MRVRQYAQREQQPNLPEQLEELTLLLWDVHACEQSQQVAEVVATVESNPVCVRGKDEARRHEQFCKVVYVDPLLFVARKLES